MGGRSLVEAGSDQTSLVHEVWECKQEIRSVPVVGGASGDL